MEFLLNFNSWFKGLPASGKISFFLVIVGMFTAGILLQSHYKTAGYQYLFTNLSITDANAIGERLQSMNVQAQIQGDAVLVPGDRVLELRNMLASEGLPRGGGVGFEIFDKKNFGETEFQQRINYIRAIQGELARTVTAIDGVETARVHLAIPEKSLFTEDEKQPTASIAISMLKGRRLSDAQIAGIVHLVVTSVEGLTDANVNIVDQNGNTLFKGSGSDGTSFSSKSLEIQANLEGKLEHRILDMLEKVVGAGGASVKVSALMNLSQVERTIEQVDPESRVALSEHVTNETSNGASGAAAGVPGAAANLPEGGGAGGASSRSENTKRNETINQYTVSKTTQRVVEPVGTVQKLSVAVLVDGTYKANEDGTKAYSARTPEEMTKLDDLVKKAIGFNQQRGDEVKVENIQFQRLDLDAKDQEAYVQATNASAWNRFMLDNGKLFGLVLVLGIVFFMLVRLVNSYAPPVSVAYANIIGQQAGDVAAVLPARAQVNIIQRNDPNVKAQQEALARQVPEVNMRRGAAGEINFVESQKSITIEAPTTSEEKLRLQAAKMQCESIIKADMNEAVQIIRAWLNEG